MAVKKFNIKMFDSKGIYQAKMVFLYTCVTILELLSRIDVKRRDLKHLFKMTVNGNDHPVAPSFRSSTSIPHLKSCIYMHTSVYLTFIYTFMQQMQFRGAGIWVHTYSTSSLELWKSFAFGMGTNRYTVLVLIPTKRCKTIIPPNIQSLSK